MQTVWGGTQGGPANTFSSYIRGGSTTPNIAAWNAISTTVAGLKLSQFASLPSPRRNQYIDQTGTLRSNESDVGTIAWYPNSLGTYGQLTYAPSGHTTYAWYRIAGSPNSGLLACSNTAIRNPTFTLQAGTWYEDWRCVCTTGNAYLTFTQRFQRSA